MVQDKLSSKRFVKGTSTFLRGHLPLLAILTLALYMRIVFPSGVVRGDDAVYAKIAYTLISEKNLALSNWNVFIRLGLYLPVSLSYLLFGVSEASTLLYPVLSSLLGIVFVFLIGEFLGGETTAIIAALVWALFPLNLALATQLYPDGVVTAFALGAVYFYLLASRAQRRRKLTLYIICLLFLMWAILIKITAIITAGFLLTYFLWEKVISKQSGSVVKAYGKNKKLLALFGIFAALLYIGQQSTPIISTLATTASDVYQTVFWGISPFLPGLKDEAFDVLLPIALISISVLMARKSRVAYFLFFWFGIQFLYLEWGSQLNIPYGFDLLHYTPLTHWVENRTTFFITPPLILLIGLYLAEGFKKKTAIKTVTTIAISGGLIILTTKDLFWSGQDIPLLDAAMAIAIPAFLVSPFFLLNSKTYFRQLVAIALVCSLALAEMRIFRGHPVERKNQQSLMSNLREAAEFIKELDPALPVASSEPNRLDYASNFELAFHDPSILSTYQTPLKIVDLNQIDLDTIDYIVVKTREFSDEKVPPRTWWLRAQFGGSSLEPVLVFQHLSEKEAQSQLAEAKNALELKIDKATLDCLMAAAVGLGDARAVVEHWSIWLDSDPEPWNISIAESMLIGYSKQTLGLSTDNLLSQEVENGSLEVSNSELLQVEYNSDPVAPFPLVQAAVLKRVDQPLFVSAFLNLKPNTLYIYTTSILSTVPTEPLKVFALDNHLVVPDSANLASVYGQWTPITVIFVTPDWEEATRDVELRLIKFEPSNPGMIWLQSPSLVEVLSAP